MAARQGPADPNDAHPAEARRGGDGGDGLGDQARTAEGRAHRRPALGCSPSASILRVMCHCWAMDSMLLTVQ